MTSLLNYYMESLSIANRHSYIASYKVNCDFIMEVQICNYVLATLILVSNIMSYSYSSTSTGLNLLNFLLHHCSQLQARYIPICAHNAMRTEILYDLVATSNSP